MLLSCCSDLGSIREIVDYTGKVKQRYDYKSYGETKISKVNPKDKFIDSPYGYTSRELDIESGDMFYRARYYNPQAGRFISEDPIDFAGGDVNLYRYVQNRPTDLTDPTGENPFAIGGAAVGGSIGFISGYLNSSSCSKGGKIGDALIGAVIGAAGGFIAGFGANAVGVLPSLGGLAVDAGINSLSIWGPSFSGHDCGCK